MEFKKKQIYIIDNYISDDSELPQSSISGGSSRKGLMLLHTGGRGTLKLTPPLCINEEAIKEAVSVIEEVMKEIIG